MMRMFKLFMLFLVLPPGLTAQVAPGIYLVEFRDKAHNQFTLDKPDAYLSQRALERRNKQNISIDSTDLPVSAFYLDSLQKAGFSILNTSRWLNSALISMNDSTLLSTLDHISFIQNHRKSLVLKNFAPLSDKLEESFIRNDPYTDSLSYGFTWQQIHFHHGETLFEDGFTGNGIQIAVLDAGFRRADSITSLQPLMQEGRVLAIRDFVDHDGEVYLDHPHGTHVLSIMAGKEPRVYIGTAPDASYYLLRSEQAATEYIAEEDNWLSAAEFADSAGADIITSSLGYTRFNDTTQNHTYAEMNGSSRISRGADIAFSKGMIVIISAGNEGNSDWEYISAPSDAFNAIAVGASDIYGNVASFSSRGPSSDGRIKPDLISVGWGTFIQSYSGFYGQGSGTSYAAPIISGLTACLWQANPSLTNRQIRQSILESCSQYESPNYIEGYGIPDFSKANNIAKLYVPWPTVSKDSFIYGPNPFTDYLIIRIADSHSPQALAQLYTISGTCISEAYSTNTTVSTKIIELHNLQHLSEGIYLLKITSGNKIFGTKVIRQ